MTLVLDSDQGSRKTEEGPKKNKGKVPLGSKPTGIIKRSSTPSSPTVSNALAIAANLKLPEIKKEPVADSAPTDSSDEGAQIWTGTMKEGKEQLVKLAVALRSGKAPVAEMERRKAAVKSFLAYLEFQATPSPGHREVLKRAFEIYSDGKYQPSIPEDIATQVRDVHQLYEDADWGEGNNDSNEVAGEEGESPGASGPDDTASPGKAVPRAGQPSAQPRRKSTASQNDGVSSVRLPAANHPIWGEYGIMHGLIYNRTARGASIAFNPNLRHLQRSAKQFGHNDLTPGDWWPLQIVAVFHGAHGHNVQGICGSATAGAWSIVCSGRSTYSELDRDQGDRLFYSADGSTTNTNPDAVVVPSNMTKALQRSFQTGQPVRVLRSAGKGDYWHPVVGIRYDGLYRIVKQHERHNKLGGMYYSFELQRLPGQRSLVDIKNSVPSAEQIAIERKIRDWY